MDWSNVNVISLISMYHDRPVLWDCRLPEYKDKNKRHDALIEISVSFGLEKIEVERKIKNLLSHFARECKKEKDTSKFGAGVDTCYKSKWFAYESMVFLKGRNKLRGIADRQLKDKSLQEEKEKGEKHQDTPVMEEQEEQEIQRKLVSTPLKNESIFKAKREKHSTMPALNEAINLMKTIESKSQEKDEYALYGEQVAIKLRKLECPHARFIVQSIINNTLFEAEMGKYDGPVFQPQQYQVPPPMCSYVPGELNVHANYSRLQQPKYNSPCSSISTSSSSFPLSPNAQSKDHSMPDILSTKSVVCKNESIDMESQDIDTILSDL